MVRDYYNYSHSDPCRETLRRYHQYRASNFVRQLHPHAYYSKRYKPSRQRYRENTYQRRLPGPSVYDSGSLCTFDRLSFFRREFKRKGSKPGEAFSQQTRKSQNGLPETHVGNRECPSGKFQSLGSSQNQFHSNESGSRFNSGYDEYPRYWASRSTPNCMNPKHGFLLSPDPYHRRRRPNRTASRFNSGYDEYPRYCATQNKEITSTVRFQPCKSTDSINNYKPSRKTRRRKANPKIHTPSERDQIADNSASDSDQFSEFQTEFAEPIHITWDGDVGKEGEHLEQKCPVCEKDLSYILPVDYSYYEDDTGPPRLPEVAVLCCGHAFHSECLMLFTDEEQSRDPPCFICISYLD